MGPLSRKVRHVVQNNRPSADLHQASVDVAHRKEQIHIFHLHGVELMIYQLTGRRGWFCHAVRDSVNAPSPLFCTATVVVVLESNG